MLRAVVFDTIPAYDRWTQTDGWTDGIAIASTALAMQALWCAVKKTLQGHLTALKVMKKKRHPFLPLTMTHLSHSKNHLVLPSILVHSSTSQYY